MRAPLYLIFFLSGAAALLFETLWFRQAGLMLGNAVWASALVTASFMAGLGIGNAFAARYGPGARRPLAIYALLEVLVGAAGVALVLGFPKLTVAVAPVLSVTTSPLALNALRVGSAFAVLVLPAAAMGATLPLLARGLSSYDPNFGRVLGRLYGWNTLGAVAGCLAGELYLIPGLGVRGAALAAGLLDLLAAAGAWMLARRWGDSPRPRLSAPLGETRRSLGGAARRLLASAFIAGALLLALEVVWFRFLQLFVMGSTLTFAVMLAVVLLGIAAGGLVASVWSARRPAARWNVTIVGLLAGVSVVTTYAAFPAALQPFGSRVIYEPLNVVRLCVWLTLPTSVLSGLIFTLLGRALQEEVQNEARATGALTLANTTGAMLGALLGGFILLPGLGVERSIFLIAVIYGLAAALVPLTAVRLERVAAGLAAALFATTLALFPFGLMGRRYVRILSERWSERGAHLVAMKEGLTETVSIFQRSAFGQPLSFRLVTNGMGLSSTSMNVRRYMGLFSWWAVAVHPEPRNALLICYGLGTTARALTDTPSLESIDVVDISRDVLEMSAVAFPQAGTNPLRDARVRVHVEDGRFFLLTTPKRYDIITAEPPHLKATGVVNLYTREYFRLLHNRLAPGGIATYWLPVFHVEAHEARSIIKAFCLEFEDCSLWTGYGYDWMLVGTRGASGTTEAGFARQWRDPRVLPHLVAAGLEGPEQLGTLFLADAPTLRALTADDPPLDDDHPYRLSSRDPATRAEPWYREMMAVEVARARFERSPLVRRLWPEGWRSKSLSAFDDIGYLNRVADVLYAGAPAPGLADLEAVLDRTSLQTVVLWYMHSSVEERDIAAAVLAGGAHDPEAWEVMGIDAMARRDYREAEEWFARAEPFAARADRLRQWRILALGLTGDGPGAARLLSEAGPLIRRPGKDADEWSWLAGRFRISLPAPIGRGAAR